jgi:hypothetical protein
MPPLDAQVDTTSASQPVAPAVQMSAVQAAAPFDTLQKLLELHV